MAARRFTPGEDSAILLAYEEMDCDWPAIAAAFGRNRKDLRTRYRLIIDKLEAENGGVKERPCLRCREPFVSSGPGNRLCEPCGANNTQVYDFGRALHMDDGPGLVYGRGFPATPGSPRA